MSSDAPAADERDDRFHTLFEQAPFSVQLLALDGRTLRVNKAWEALWQVSLADPEFKRFLFDEYNVLDDPELAAQGMSEPLRRAFKGESVSLPTFCYDPGAKGMPGRARWVRAHAHPVKDESGVLREVMLIHEDVTDQWDAQRALQASEVRLKQLANTIPQLAWMADPQGDIHWYNDRWYDYTGRSPQDMQGWGWRQVHDPQVLPQVLARWAHSLATGEAFEMTFPLLGRDGSFRPFYTRVEPLKDVAGRVTQWFGTNTDVSALQAAEQQLRQAEERLRLATHAGHIGIWDWDILNDRVSWSEQVYALHGLAPGQFGGRAADFAARVHPNDRDAVWAKILEAIRLREDFSAEFRVVLPDGGERWLSTWARLRDDSSGEASRMIGATISIDAYKKAEAALRDSDRRKDEFLAMLAHELRNPLAAISAATQLLQAQPDLLPKVRQGGDVIARQVTHVTKLVDDLLDVSRVTRGLIELERRVESLPTLLEHAVEQARPVLEAGGHRFEMRGTGQPARVFADGTRLVQAVVNLLSNAAKYTPPGGAISLSLTIDGASARIAVQDNGVGIEAALRPHMFELFTQGTRSPGRAEGGLGIGLALVRSIAELHGGTIEARAADDGVGSCFTLGLPLWQHDDAPCAAVDVAAAAAGEALSVLVVDDNRDVADSMQVLLEMAGHRVQVVYDATSALQVAPPPQVFILDIGLPDMDGHELARRLRERAGDALFIALTGYGQSQDRQRSAAAGFDHHLVKPIDLEVLAQLLAAHGSAAQVARHG